MLLGEDDRRRLASGACRRPKTCHSRPSFSTCFASQRKRERHGPLLRPLTASNSDARCTSTVGRRGLTSRTISWPRSVAGAGSLGSPFTEQRVMRCWRHCSPRNGDGDRHVAVARSGWLGQIVPKRGSELDNHRPRSSADTYGSWARVCSGRVRERASRRGLAPWQKGRSKRACLRGMPTQDYNLWSCLRVD